MIISTGSFIIVLPQNAFSDYSELLSHLHTDVPKTLCSNYYIQANLAKLMMLFTHTFLPSPHSDGVLRIHSHRQQEFSCGAEVDVSESFGVRAAQHRERLFTHGVPHVNGRRQAYRNTDTSSPSILPNPIGFIRTH